MHNAIPVELKKIVLLAFILTLSSSAVYVEFIKPVEAQGTIYIRADGSIEGTTNITTADNIIYTFTGNIHDEIVVERSNIVIDGDGYTLQGTGVSWSNGIDLSGRTNVTVRNIIIKKFWGGIYLWESSNNSISGNDITANKMYSIMLLSSSNNSINGNNINGNSITGNKLSGIYLDSSSNNSISGNKITNNFDGIRLWNSSNNSISGNNITANDSNGILLWNSSNCNSISGNKITNNGFGIHFEPSSNNNNISDNIITNNIYGIMLGFSSNNRFYHNHFIDNSQQVSVYPSEFTNVWDDGYPSGGNYWSDYIATANDTYSGPFQNETGSSFPKYTSDGIGDTEYIIDANNTDNYPLMGMFSDFKATSEYHVQTICSSTVVDFQYNGTAISFNVIGGNETVGFCRICVPTGLMNDTYTVIVNHTWGTFPAIYTLLPCSNSTHSYLYFGLNPSVQKVIIIPEFPTWTSMLLLLVVLTVAIVTYNRRLSGA